LDGNAGCAEKPRGKPLTHASQGQRQQLQGKEHVMFADTKAFSAFAVDDLAQARKFYGQTPGIGVSEQHGLLTLNLAGGHDDRGITRGGGPFIAAWFKDPAGNLLEVLQER
jgi:hypothetical protein